MKKLIAMMIATGTITAGPSTGTAWEKVKQAGAKVSTNLKDAAQTAGKKVSQAGQKVKAAFTPTESAARPFKDDQDILAARGCWFGQDAAEQALWLRARSAMQGNVDLFIKPTESHGILILEAHNKEVPAEIAQSAFLRNPSPSQPNRTKSYLQDSSLRSSHVIDFNQKPQPSTAMQLQFDDKDTFIYCLRPLGRGAHLVPCNRLLSVSFCQVNEPLSLKNLRTPQGAPFQSTTAVVDFLSQQRTRRLDIYKQKHLDISAFDILLTANSRTLKVDRRSLAEDEYGALGFTKGQKLTAEQIVDRLEELVQKVEESGILQDIAHEKLGVTAAGQNKVKSEPSSEQHRLAPRLVEQAIDLLYKANDILLEQFTR